MTQEETYQGWKNYQTWNVSLWIGNDDLLYRGAVRFMSEYAGNRPYSAFIRRFGLADGRTPDRIKWLSNALDYDELNDMMRELAPQESETMSEP